MLNKSNTKHSRTSLEHALDSAFPLPLPEVLPNLRMTERLSAQVRVEVARLHFRRMIFRIARVCTGAAAALWMVAVMNSKIPGLSGSDSDMQPHLAATDVELLHDLAGAASRTARVAEGLLADDRRWLEYDGDGSGEQDLEALREAFRKLGQIGA